MRDDNIIESLLRELDELRRRINEAIDDSIERIKASSQMNSGDNTSNEGLKDSDGEQNYPDETDVDSVDVLSKFLRSTLS
jgi:hypothetical protein